MKHLAHLVAVLAGALPALSFIIPDERIVNQAFRYQDRAESDSSQLEEFRKKFEKIEDRVEDRLNSILDKIEKIEEIFGEDDIATSTGAIALDDGFDAFYGVKEEKPFPDTYEYFDSEAWLSHYTQSTDALFASFPYEDLTSEHHDHNHHDHDHHGHHGHDHDGHCKHPHLPPHDPHDHTDSTIFEILSKSKYTTKLAEYIKLDDDFANLLKDENANITIFAPGDRAFERIHHKDPKDVPKDLLKRILNYHAVEGIYEAHDLIAHNTLRTKLDEEELGKGVHQRLRVGLGIHGPAVNYYSRITVVNIRAKNGVIHGLASILFPPPSVLKIVEVVPTAFSTSEAAFYRSGLVDELDKGGDGLTVFLPSNKDWEKLGYAINAFLFSERGKQCLKAIMKYHIVRGHTLYSDAYVSPDHKKSTGEHKDPDGLPFGYTHLSLPTLLEDESLSVDIHRYGRFLSFRVNGAAVIAFPDAIAKNGAIHIPDHVLIPPHGKDSHHDPANENEGEKEMTVEELKARLAPYMSTESEL